MNYSNACYTCYYLNFSSRIQWKCFQNSRNDLYGAGGHVDQGHGRVHHVSGAVVHNT